MYYTLHSIFDLVCCLKSVEELHCIFYQKETEPSGIYTSLFRLTSILW